MLRADEWSESLASRWEGWGKLNFSTKSIPYIEHLDEKKTIMENITKSCVEISSRCGWISPPSVSIIDLRQNFLVLVLTYERCWEDKAFGKITPAVSIPVEWMERNIWNH